MRQLIIVALFIAALVTTVSAQPAKLSGYVVNVGNIRIPNVRVKVPGGHAVTTDSKGQFTIQFPSSVQPGQATRIEIDKPGWVIYLPISGDCLTQHANRNYQPLKVTIVPKGSLLALSPRRLSRVIAKWAAERAKAKGELIELKSKLDEYAFFRDYAQKYGFTLEQFMSAAQQWAESAESKDKEEQAIKEYFLKRYDRAAQLAREAALSADEALERSNREKHKYSQEVISRFTLEANILLTQGKFKEALVAGNDIDQRFLSGKISKADFLQEWGATKILLGVIKAGVAALTRNETRKILASESVNEFNQAFSIFTREASPQQWATTQLSIAFALGLQGEAMPNDEGLQFLSDAVVAIRQAFDVITSQNIPIESARIHIALGTGLAALAEKTKGADSERLFTEAIDAFKEAARIFLKEGAAKDWAMAQTILGRASITLAMRVDKLRSTELFHDAQAAFESAVTVLKRDQMPDEWAWVQLFWGQALNFRAQQLGGEEGERLLAQAVQTYTVAITVFNINTSPPVWAMLQSNLGISLGFQAAAYNDQRSQGLFIQAAEAFNKALTVFTPESAPQQWLMTKQWLARTYFVLNKWQDLVKHLKDILDFDPTNREAFEVAVSTQHDLFFEYHKSFALAQNWLKNNPETPSVLAGFAENHFTTERFAECEQRINVLLSRSDLDVEMKIALRAIQIANLLAMGESENIPARMELLLADADALPPHSQITWQFGGVRHFIDQQDKLASRRQWLGMLFSAIEGKRREEMLEALQRVRAEFGDR
jgi:tetratricopeptide (TPR) repeat protein